MITTILNTIFLLSMPGGSEWILIILVVLLMFGGKKIPELMRGVGRGIREFQDAKTSVKNEIEDGMKEKEIKTETAQKQQVP
ncbi:MAG: twin-arginine translocase TatA/TatE family subunit [Ferruginibacter sp.]